MGDREGESRRQWERVRESGREWERVIVWLHRVSIHSICRRMVSLYIGRERVRGSGRE